MEAEEEAEEGGDGYGGGRRAAEVFVVAEEGGAVVFAEAEAEGEACEGGKADRAAAEGGPEEGVGVDVAVFADVMGVIAAEVDVGFCFGGCCVINFA